MKVELSGTPWYVAPPSAEAEEALGLLNGVWAIAAERFAVQIEINRLANKPPPRGVQKFINSVIDKRFKAGRWQGEDSRFRKGGTWFRVTFRHQMSLGSDLLEAVRLPKAEAVTQCVILAASDDFLRVITPGDWRVLSSYPKLSIEVGRLLDVFEPPLLIGELSPASPLSATAQKAVFGSRLTR